MAVIIDGVLKEWGDALRDSPVRGRKGRRGQRKGGGMASAAKIARAPAARMRRLVATVRRAPEVMVKISGGGKCLKQIRAHFDYISRNGQVVLEDDLGQRLAGRGELPELAAAWKLDGHRIADEHGTKREAFNIILSMPAGTDRTAVTNAARDFAHSVFDGHQFVFATHDDEPHPHVHLVVKAVGFDGRRLNPRKGDLQIWREVFAEKLWSYGIEANATPRRLRGITRRPESQVVRRIARRGEVPRVQVQQQKTLLRLLRGDLDANPAQEVLTRNRRDTLNSYARIAQLLSQSSVAEHRKLAVSVVRFAQAMPAVATWSDEIVRTPLKGRGLVLRDVSAQSLHRKKDQDKRR